MMRAAGIGVVCGLVLVIGTAATAPFEAASPGSTTAVQGAAGKPPAAVAKGPAAVIADVAWIAGPWAGSAGPASIEEHWTTPAGGSMLAVARTLRGTRMVAFEFLRIVERNQTLVYIAQPNGRPPTEFTLTAFDATSATFENPAHDFPKKIAYVKRADGALEATVSGDGKSESFVFHRQSK